MVLVGGLNGCGKTTFLDSLQLVLYGNRARLSNRGSQKWDDYLRDSINRDVPDSQGASIELSFTVGWTAKCGIPGGPPVASRGQGNA